MTNNKRLLNIIFLILVFITYSCSKSDTIIDEGPSYDNHYSDGDVQIIFENDPINGINVIFMGDAYKKVHLERETGKYYLHAMANIDALFNTPPFSEYQEHFNAYIIYAESEDSYPSTEDIQRNTRFGSEVTTHPATGLTTLKINYHFVVNEFVAAVKSRPRNNRDLILLSVNNSDRGSAVFNSKLAIAGNGRPNIMIHEIGHAFSGLADEYFFNGNLVSYDTNNDHRDNLDYTDNLELIKWNHFIGLEGYSNVGAYEGGGYNQFDIWRPQFNSIMRSESVPYFNAPSRESIVRKIYQLRNLEFDFQEFLLIDQISMGNRDVIFDHQSEIEEKPEFNLICNPHSFE